LAETVPTRFVSDTPGGDDDRVVPFQVDALDARGRSVRLGSTLDAILSRHAYPEPVSRLLGEAVALTALLGTALKLQGQFQLQTRTDGPVNMLVVDFVAPGSLRAYARFDEARVTSAKADELLGKGHLAFTIDQGNNTQRYQGLVPLDGQGLEAAAHEYFLRSEQIPTRVRLAVAEQFSGGARQWRAGGIMVQFLPQSTDRQRQAEFDPGDAPEGTVREGFVEDEAWVEARSLVETTEDIELIDPAVTSERLLYRLFHERGVRVYESTALIDKCRCSSERILDMLKSFSDDDKQAMVGEDGMIGVTCEFCSTRYHFRPDDIRSEAP